MKKLMTIAAVAICAATVYGSDGIQSANVVGYQNITFDKSGWMMNIGVQFSNVQSEDGTWTNGDTFFGTTATEGDQIFTLDANAWNLSQYNKKGVNLGWVLIPADGSASEYFAAIKGSKGDLYYYIPLDADTTSDVLVSGQVAPVGEQSVTFDVDNADGQWMFPLVNPFPIATSWGDLNAFTKEGDQLFTLDGDAWNLNQYNRKGDGLGWVLIPADGSASESITDDTIIAIPAGGAAYYVPMETVTWTVTL